MTGGNGNSCEPTPRVFPSDETSVVMLADCRQPNVLPDDAPEHSGVLLTNVCHACSRTVALYMGIVDCEPDSKIYEPVIIT